MSDVAKTIAELAQLHTTNKEEALGIILRAGHMLLGMDVGVDVKRYVKETEPQSEPEKPPKKQRICKAGRKCVNRRGEEVFEIVADVYDGMKYEDFAKCFKPLKGVDFPDEISHIEMDEHGCRMDDPLSGDELGLLLWGSWPQAGSGLTLGKGNKMVKEDAQVGSIGEGDLDI